MATLTLKEHFREVSRGRPGHRFQDYYRRAKEDRKSGAAKDRVIRMALAVGMFAIGLVLVFIPGPAILFFFFAGALVASESLVVSKALDWLEVQLRALWRWGKERWRRFPLGAKIALVILALALGCGAAWLGWKLVAG